MGKSVHLLAGTTALLFPLCLFFQVVRAAEPSGLPPRQSSYQENPTSMAVRMMEEARRKEQEIRQREEELRAREERLNALKRELEKLSRDVDKREKELKGSPEKRQQDNSKEEGAMAHLAKLVEAAPSEQGAKLLGGLEPETAAKVLSRMNPKKAGRLLVSMDPDKATRVSQALIKGDR
jgi:flagellar motility protein MotE (MotC chaperone)